MTTGYDTIQQNKASLALKLPILKAFCEGKAVIYTDLSRRLTQTNTLYELLNRDYRVAETQAVAGVWYQEYTETSVGEINGPTHTGGSTWAATNLDIPPWVQNKPSNKKYANEPIFTATSEIPQDIVVDRTELRCMMEDKWRAYIPIIEAFLEGKTIEEYQSYNGGNWVETITLRHILRSKYRIKDNEENCIWAITFSMKTVDGLVIDNCVVHLQGTASEVPSLSSLDNYVITKNALVMTLLSTRIVSKA